MSNLRRRTLEEDEDMAKWELIEAFDITDIVTSTTYSVDISGYTEVNIFFNQIVSNNDSASLLLLINGINCDYLQCKTTATNAWIKLRAEGYVTAERTYASQTGNYWNTEQAVGRNISGDWSAFGDELVKFGVRFSASAYSGVSGTIEVYGR